MPDLPYIGCRVMAVPDHLRWHAADLATRANPANQLPRPTGLPDGLLPPAYIAAYTTKLWRAGTTLTVGFLDPASAALKAKILGHMNAWADGGVAVDFVLTNVDPEIRIAFAPQGYWSYVGTDVLSIPAPAPTMNLEGGLVGLPDSEYTRVVRHETGHTLGAPHEHERAAIIALLDRALTLAYYERWQGWSEAEVIDQVLTPIPEAELTASPASVRSIMSYPFPASVTLANRAIPGGTDIQPDDLAKMRAIYPRVVAPPPPSVNPPVVPPPTPPADSLPTLVVGGPGAALAVHPAGPARFAVDGPPGGTRLVVRFAVAAPSFWDMWAFANGTITGPDGTVTPFHFAAGDATLGLHAAGRHVVAIGYPLDRTLTVKLLAAG
jgi:hypothetical protein